jgi:protein O-GlcNAc transferase
MFRIFKSHITSQPDSGNLPKKSLQSSTDNIADILLQIRNYFRDGDLDGAGRLCRQVLDVDPGIAEAWYYLGLITYRQGKSAEGLDCLRNATECDPNWAEASNHYGNALRDHDRLDEALEMYHKALCLKSDYAAPHYNIGLVMLARENAVEAEQSFRRALDINPEFVEAINCLALLQHNQGRSREAVAQFREALRYSPDNLVALNNMGIALIALKQTGEAVEVCRRAVAVAPTCAEAHNTLGLALSDVGMREEAIACYRQVIELNPEHPEAHNNLGVVFKDMCRLEEAEQYCRKALSLRPAYAKALNNLGIVLKELGRTVEAAVALEKALELCVDNPIAWNNLGLVRRDQAKLEKAINCYNRAIACQPDNADAINNLGGALVGQGKIEEAIAAYLRAIKADPHFPDAYSNMLLTMQYSSRFSEEDIFRESGRWEDLFGTDLRIDHPNMPDPDRRLWVGYVSNDFRRHSVSYFLRELFEHHSRSDVSLVCYSDVLSPDEHTGFFKSHAEFWRNTAGLSDDDVAGLVRKDKIDILVDLAGHTGKRLPLFARKPAPIQVTWLGYPGTTGLYSIDYRVSDDIADPVGESDRLHSEKLCRLPGGFLCYNPAEDAPEVAPLPCIASGHITFGSFNSLAKITPEVIELWSKLLGRLQDARLIIKNHSFADEATHSRFKELMCGHGVPSERFDLRPWERSRASHLSVYGEIDIALDTFPYNGTTTTCEALWMGVPVVTVTGKRHAGRVGASILSRVGLSDLVAESTDAYLEIVETLARDMNRLTRIRSSLRNTMQLSSLCDGVGFAASVENEYRRIWREWCEERIKNK